jgi:hypothetical protein
MDLPPLAPRRSIGGVAIVWAAAAVAGTAVGFLAPASWRIAWLGVTLGLCVALAFAVQLASGRSQAFVERVALSTLGAAVILGVISLGFGLASIVPG